MGALGLGACTMESLSRDHAQRIAAPAHLQNRPVPAGSFTLSGYERIYDAKAPLHVYIEGRNPGGKKPVWIIWTAVRAARAIRWPCTWPRGMAHATLFIWHSRAS